MQPMVLDMINTVEIGFSQNLLFLRIYYVQQGQSAFNATSEPHKYWNCAVEVTDKFSILTIEGTCFNEVHQSLLCRQYMHLKIFSS